MSSIQLDAFLAIARTKSFSAAAKLLHVTQSALSQRMLNLESDLETSLFVRESHGIRLTDVGQSLLQYAQTKEGLEREFLESLRSKDHLNLSGLIRIASFSTYVRSMLLPKIVRFSLQHPAVRFDIMTREMRELPEMLKSGEVDFMISTDDIQRQDLETFSIGEEKNVLIESKKIAVSHRDIYFDHDEWDETTHRFWQVQKAKPSSYRRMFLDEIYAIIDAVEMGIGRAVVPEHLVRERKTIKIVSDLKPMVIPVHVSHYRQAYYTKLQAAFLQLLRSR